MASGVNNLSFKMSKIFFLGSSRAVCRSRQFYISEKPRNIKNKYLFVRKDILLSIVVYNSSGQIYRKKQLVHINLLFKLTTYYNDTLKVEY